MKSIKGLYLWSFLFSNFTAAFRMVNAYKKGTYHNIPYKTIAKIIIGLLYVFLFIDFIPDFIPIVGWLDDIAVISWVLNAVSDEIQLFREWEVSR